MNTIGNIFKLTTFGESHGKAIGGIIDGCPAGIELDVQDIQKELDRRKPGQSKLTTSRNEADVVEILSGVFDGKTIGTSIGFIVRNKDAHSADYDNIKNIFRPSHADYTYQRKYGIRDHRGGGRSSARETVARVVGGAIAKKILEKYDLKITAYTSQVGNVNCDKNYQNFNFSEIEKNLVRCPNPDTAKKMQTLIEKVKEKGDSIGGVITCVMQGVPVGLGAPVFGKLQSMLAGAMLSINAVKGFEYGDGFDVSHLGSERNDIFDIKGDNIRTITNHSGGIQGGISNGEDIYFRVAFKPVATVFKEQNTVDIEGCKVIHKTNGRHDPCVLPRAVPIVEAMASLIMADCLLMNKTDKLN